MGFKYSKAIFVPSINSGVLKHGKELKKAENMKEKVRQKSTKKNLTGNLLLFKKLAKDQDKRYTEWDNQN